MIVVCLASTCIIIQLLPVSLTRCSPPRPPVLPRITLEASNQERGTKEFAPNDPGLNIKQATMISRCKLHSPPQDGTSVPLQSCTAQQREAPVRLSWHPTRRGKVASSCCVIISFRERTSLQVYPLGCCIWVMPVRQVGKNFVIKSDGKQISFLL